MDELEDYGYEDFSPICDECVFFTFCSGVKTCDNYSEEFDEEYYDFFDDLDDDGYVWSEMSYRRYKNITYKWNLEPTEWELSGE